MHKGRVEAFSDGVFAILITIMVLELRAPHGANVTDLVPLIPIFLSYLLSFIYLGIYWSNHHHFFQLVKDVRGPALWANLHLLFWLSLIPFVTAWTGENKFQTWPVAIYGFVLFMCGIAYFIMVRVLVHHHGKDSQLGQAMGSDRKGLVSVALYLLAIALAFVSPFLSCAIYVGVAILWIVPDRRVERVMAPSP